MQHTIELVANTNDKCGEAPTWDQVSDRLIWVDCDSNLVREYKPATGQVKLLCDALPASGVVANRNGSWVFAGGGGIHVWCDSGEHRTVITEFEGEKLVFNDLIADAKGRIYAGTLYWGGGKMTRYGKLYLIDVDGSMRVVDEGIELSNGLGFSVDNRTLYYADSCTRKIFAYDVDAASGALANRRVFVRVPDDEGIPDGLTVDAAGYVWSAQWYGAQIVRYDPDGKVERRIVMPVKQVSSCQFGGCDLTDLYATTAGVSWEGPYAPPGYDFKTNIGGALYRVRLDVQGKPEHVAGLA